MRHCLVAAMVGVAASAAAGQVLTTTHAGGDTAWGVMFDLEALRPDVRTPWIGLGTTLTEGSNIACSIWTRPGGFAGHTQSSEGWTLVTPGGSGFVLNGELRVSMLLHVWPANQTTGVYIEITSPLPAAPLKVTPIPPAQGVYEDSVLRLSGGVSKGQGGFGGPVTAGRMVNASVRVTACYADCEAAHTIGEPLNVNDFICFQTAYAGGLPYANCDGSTVEPVLNVNDFLCFMTRYSQGCAAR